MSRNFSRIDRIYTNADAVSSGYLRSDYHLPAYKTWISDHRPVSLSLTPRPSNKGHCSRPYLHRYITEHPDFESIVNKLLLQDPRHISNNPQTSAENELRALTDAFLSAQKEIMLKKKQLICNSPQDKLAVAHAIIIHVTTTAGAVDLKKIAGWLRAYPEISPHFYPNENGVWTFDHVEVNRCLLSLETECINSSATGQPFGDTSVAQASMAEKLSQMRTQRKPIEYIYDSSRNRHTNDPTEMRKIVEDYYGEILDPKTPENIDAQNAWLNNLPDDFRINHANWLVSEQMIEETIILCGKKKSSPGPDGIPFQAFHATLTESSRIIGRLITDIREGRPLSSNFRDCYLYLIPKTADHELLINEQPVSSYSPSKTRPITVSNSFCRIISKCILCVFKNVVHNFLHADQCAYVGNGQRLISHNIEVVNKFLHSRSGRNSEDNGLQSHILFVDFSNAFTSLKHSFIRKYLAHIGIPDFFVNLLCFPLATDNTLVFAGSHSRTVSSTTGCRQGCPLAGPTFILILESLLYRLRNLEIGHGHDCTGRTLRHKPRCLAYADDIAMLLKSLMKGDLRKIVSVFSAFELASNLSVNIGKTHLVPTKARVAQRFYGLLRDTAWGDFSQNIRDREKYLGVLVGRNVKVKDVTEIALCKATEEITFWKNQNISFAQKVCVVNSFIYSKLEFICQFFILNDSDVNHLHAECRRLFTELTFCGLSDLSSFANLVGAPTSSFPRNFRLWNYACILRRLFPLTNVPEDCLATHSIAKHCSRALSFFRETTGLEFFSPQGKRELRHAPHVSTQSTIYNLLVKCSPENDDTYLKLKTRITNRFLPRATDDDIKNVLRNIKDTLRVCVPKPPNWCLFDFFRALMNGVATDTRRRHGDQNVGRLSCRLCGSFEDSTQHYFSGQCRTVETARQLCDISTSSIDLLLCRSCDPRSFLFVFSVIRTRHLLPAGLNAQHIASCFFVRNMEGSKTKIKKHKHSARLPPRMAFVYSGSQFHVVDHIHDNMLQCYSYSFQKTRIPVSLLSLPCPEIHIFLDGSSAKSDEDWSGGYGYAILGISQFPIEFCGPVPGHDATNNVSELYSAAHCFYFLITNVDALLHVFNVRCIKFFFDSKYVLGMISGKWRRSEEQRLNDISRHAWKLYNKLISFRHLKVQYSHVYSHTHNIPNELADRLADLGRLGEVRSGWDSITDLYGSPSALNFMRSQRPGFIPPPPPQS